MIRIMSNNIYHKNAKDFDHLGIAWEERLEIVADVYRTYLPDFLGLQEVNFMQRDLLLEMIEDLYEIVDFPDAPKNNTPIWYRRGKYEIVDKMYYDFTNGRHFEWALYKEVADEKQLFIHMNLHYNPYPDKQEDDAKFVNAELRRVMRLYPDVPIAVTGDYNNTALSDTYNTMVEGLPLASGAGIVGNVDSTYYTWHYLRRQVLEEWDAKKTMKGPIDIITITPKLLEVKDYKVICDLCTCRGSDHYPVYLDVERVLREKN